MFQHSASGPVETEMSQNFPPDIFEKAKNTLLVGHIGTPDEVAEAYIFAMKVSEFLLDR